MNCDKNSDVPTQINTTENKIKSKQKKHKDAYYITSRYQRLRTRKF